MRPHLLERGLAPLSLRFLDVYVPKLEAYGETGVAAKLTRWRERLVS